ncbi:MAG: hypothetical protein NVSMB65_17030 [Chloroflexota bacterium]
MGTLGCPQALVGRTEEHEGGPAERGAKVGYPGVWSDNGGRPSQESAQGRKIVTLQHCGRGLSRCPQGLGDALIGWAAGPHDPVPVPAQVFRQRQKGGQRPAFEGPCCARMHHHNRARRATPRRVPCSPPGILRGCHALRGSVQEWRVR